MSRLNDPKELMWLSEEHIMEFACSELIEGRRSVTKEEVTRLITAAETVRDVLRIRPMKWSGPCLCCQMEWVNYRVFSRHFEMGDEWLKSYQWEEVLNIIRLPDDPDEYGRDRYIINKVGIESWGGYICQKCKGLLAPVLDLVESYPDDDNFSDGASLERKVITQAAWARITAEALALAETHSASDANRLKYMRYRDFLKTDYWNIVRKYARVNAGNQCMLGCTEETLHVHHKKYKHRGDEIHHMSDLVVLCDTCHKKYHNKFTYPE